MAEFTESYHRHVRVMTNVADTIDILYGRAPQEFGYCAVCGSIPLEFIAKTPRCAED